MVSNFYRTFFNISGNGHGRGFSTLYPKSKFIPVNSFFLLLPSILICFWLNNDLIYSVLSKENVAQFVFTNDILNQIIDVHLRAIGAIILCLIVHHFLEFINDWGGKKRALNANNKCCLVRLSFFLLSCLEKLLKKFDDLISHPWVAYLRHNKKIEMLIADIFTEDGNLYRGRFLTFQEKERDVSVISIGNAFRYYASTESSSKDHQNRYNKKDEPKVIHQFSERKHRLIKNSGLLLVPYSKIKNNTPLETKNWRRYEIKRVR